jgi:carbamoylphosphate synthase small subunit
MKKKNNYLSREMPETIMALLALEDGRVFDCRSFTGSGEASGEIVFNTGMTGYQEILTDPSYYGQLVTMTYPLIGNYGVNPEDMESGAIQAEAILVKGISARTQQLLRHGNPGRLSPAQRQDGR